MFNLTLVTPKCLFFFFTCSHWIIRLSLCLPLMLQRPPQDLCLLKLAGTPFNQATFVCADLYTGPKWVSVCVWLDTLTFPDFPLWQSYINTTDNRWVTGMWSSLCLWGSAQGIMRSRDRGGRMGLKNIRLFGWIITVKVLILLPPTG